MNMLYLHTWSSVQSPRALTAVCLCVLTAAGQLPGLSSREGEGRKERICQGDAGEEINIAAKRSVRTVLGPIGITTFRPSGMVVETHS